MPIAVAAPIVLIPIVAKVESIGFTTISAEAKALAKKAGDGILRPPKYHVRPWARSKLIQANQHPQQGGTLTVSNLGRPDISHFPAIIDPPQSCALAIGATGLVRVPETQKSFKTAQIMRVTLSSDHRTVDGVVGARWLTIFKGILDLHSI